MDTWILPNLKVVGLATLFCAAAANWSFAQTLTTLASFDAMGAPIGNLIQGQDGNFYGTTTAGGSYRGGTIFKLTPAGTLTVLYAFCSQAHCTDGQAPTSGVVQGADGNFYGTTSIGGGHAEGSVFKVTPAGALTTLYSFCSLTPCTDGANPNGMVQATDGNFYGTTYTGGTNNVGTVFRINASGTLTTLHSFCSLADCADGADPTTGLIQGNDGNLYGTTSGTNTIASGFNPSYDNEGTIFKITLAGNLTALFAFCPNNPDCPDGQSPNALVEGTDGILYGLTQAGSFGFSGPSFFAVSRLGGGSSDPFLSIPGLPTAGLVQYTDGNLYGTLDYGGQYGVGAIIKITLSGAVTTLYSFCAQMLTLCPDGELPQSALIVGTDGNFYGTTAGGIGTVFRLSLSLPTIQFTAGGAQTVTGAGATTKAIPIVFTLAGAQPLTLVTASSNTTLLPNSGISVSNGCGITTLICTATLSIAPDQIGPSTITLTVTDPSGHADTASATLTVNEPASPTVTISGGGSQAINEGGALTPISFTLTGIQPVTVAAMSTNATLLPQSGVTISSGCGTTSLNCTATLDIASGQSGTSAITITATDPYSQSGSGVASLKVKAPSQGGSGAMDVVYLMGLALALLLRCGRACSGNI